MVSSLEVLCRDAGLSVGRNTPFSGSYVPLRYLGDPRVASLMVEVRRDGYMDETTGERRDGFEQAAAFIEDVLGVVARWVKEEHPCRPRT